MDEAEPELLHPGATGTVESDWSRSDGGASD